ncbi:MAG: RHS repeat-associated core domain-containing protein [Phycisphaerae bacterium]|nr:RHS repeat-associated core domain-containing protein [Phycisphaerae bacterium]
MMHVIPAQAGTQDLYYAHDHLYSPVALFAANGTVAERYEYDAYGNCQILNSEFLILNSSQHGNPYAFTGRELDTLDAGRRTLMYYRARTIDPETGRFMQRDPLMYIDGMNVYEYVKSNPNRWSDPLGLHIDFNPNGPKAPVLPKNGKRWDFSASWSNTMHLRLYSFFLRDRYYIWDDGTSAEYAILGGNFLLDVRGQSEVLELNASVERRLELDALVALARTDIGSYETFSDRNRQTVWADFLSTNVRLSLQGFTVYWDSQCKMGPIQCREGKKSAFWHCKTKWTLYDLYDFAWYDIPYGYLGKPFHIFGYWDTTLTGTVTRKI